jgi:hypothetical protein
LGADSLEVAQYPGHPSQIGLEPGISGWQFRAWQKRGEDIAYSWKGKGSTIHLVTESNGLPLAFLVTAANISEVTVGLKVIDQVKVPRTQGRPRQRTASLAADKSYDSPDFWWELRQRGIQPVHSKTDVEKPPLLAKQTSSGTSTQPESVEGGTQPRLAGQLEEIGHQV